MVQTKKTVGALRQKVLRSCHFVIYGLLHGKTQQKSLA
jgi:hypothetical protein